MTHFVISRLRHLGRFFILGVCVISLGACGTITGIPSHGGGKRFAVEQEMISSSAKAAIRGLDITSLRGRRVVLRMSAIGDQGAGNLLGGRYNIRGLLQGGLVNAPTTTVRHDYPVISTTATTTSGTSTSHTVADSALNAPSRSVTRSDGGTGNVTVGVSLDGLGDYQNSTLITNVGDTAYLLSLLQSYFYLEGVEIVEPEQAEVAVLVTVDVFGTIRRRNDWHLFNQERLIAKTSLELMAIDLRDGSRLISPVSSSYEAEYNEQYVLWSGPYQTHRTVRKSSPLLVDFRDVGSGFSKEVTRTEGLMAPVSFGGGREEDALAADPREVEALGD